MHHNKQSNQLFLKLKDQLLLENKICEHRQDMFHIALTLLCDSCFSEEIQKYQITDLFNDLSDVSEVTPSNVHEVITQTYVCEKYGKDIPSNLYSQIEHAIAEIAEIDNFPLAIKGGVLFFARKAKKPIQAIKTLEEDLVQKGTAYIADGRIELAIDSLWGTSYCIKKDVLKGFVDQIIRNEDQLSREKFAKAILVLLDWDQSPPDQMISILEKKIEIDFNNWVIPDILFALIESEKLINSNIPKATLESIYTSLKQAGANWTKLIDSVSDNGIVIDMKHFIRMPAFSPVEDTLSLLALTHCNRQTIYQIEAAEYEEYQKYLKVAANEAMISAKSVAFLVAFALFEILVFSGITLSTWDSLNSFIKGLYSQNIIPKNIEELVALLTNPILSAWFFISWFHNYWNATLENKKPTFGNMIKNVPILRRWLKG